MKDLFDERIVTFATQQVFCIASGNTGLDHTPSPLGTLQILPLEVSLNHWHLRGSATWQLSCYCARPMQLRSASSANFAKPGMQPNLVTHCDNSGHKYKTGTHASQVLAVREVR